MKPILITFICLLQIKTLAVDVVSFTPSQTPNVSHIVRWGTSPGVITGSLNIGTNTSLTMSNGPWGVLYYSAVAVAANGVQSYPSGEVSGTNVPYAPTQLRVIPSVYLTPP